MEILKRMFRARGEGASEAAAWQCYRGLVARARTPDFYRACQVPDSVDGRFEMIVVHVFCILNRLKTEGEGGRDFSKHLTTVMMTDMDRNLREMGVGDLSVGKKVKFMSKALNGRLAAYDAGLAGGRAHLIEALKRNVYGTVTVTDAPVGRLADDMIAVVRFLQAQALEPILSGRAAFPPVASEHDQDP